MLPVIRERAVESAVDIGASEGYFSIMLVHQLDVEPPDGAA